MKWLLVRIMSHYLFYIDFISRNIDGLTSHPNSFYRKLSLSCSSHFCFSSVYFCVCLGDASICLYVCAHVEARYWHQAFPPTPTPVSLQPVFLNRIFWSLQYGGMGQKPQGSALTPCPPCSASPGAVDMTGYHVRSELRSLCSYDWAVFSSHSLFNSLNSVVSLNNEQCCIF